MMNLGFNYSPFAYYSPENAAAYYNSMYPPYNMAYMESYPPYYQTNSMHYPYYPPYSHCKTDSEAERSTADSQDQAEEMGNNNAEVKIEEDVKRQAFIHTNQALIHNLTIQAKAKLKKEKRSNKFRKNTESNVANNIISYVCSQAKSHKAIQRLLTTAQQKKIFYIFMNNLKKLNKKYLNRDNVTDLLQLQPDKPLNKTLNRSVRRLLVLPIPQLRVILRRLIYDYLRTDACLVPILSSKKISRVSLKEHLEKRRELLQYFFKGK